MEEIQTNPCDEMNALINGLWRLQGVSSSDGCRNWLGGYPVIFTKGLSRPICGDFLKENIGMFNYKSF